VQPGKHSSFFTPTVATAHCHLTLTTYQLHFNYSVSWESQYQRTNVIFQVYEITHRLRAPGKKASSSFPCSSIISEVLLLQIHWHPWITQLHNHLSVQ